MVDSIRLASVVAQGVDACHRTVISFALSLSFTVAPASLDVLQVAFSQVVPINNLAAAFEKAMNKAMNKVSTGFS